MSVRGLYVLHVGDIDVDRAIFAPGLGDGQRIRIPVPAYLIDTTDGWLLIDTGQHEAHIADPDHTWRGTHTADAIRPQMRPEHSLRSQLGLLELDPSDIAVVVNTHFHYDHCGENRLFPGHRIVVQRTHYEAALNAPGYPSQYFNGPELRYDLIDGERELVTGVECLLAPGHAPGLIALLVRLPEGPVLLGGDAIPVCEVIEHGIWAGFRDPDDARRSAARLIERAASERAPIVYGHDPDQWQQLTKAPTALDVTHLGTSETCGVKHRDGLVTPPAQTTATAANDTRGEPGPTMNQLATRTKTLDGEEVTAIQEDLNAAGVRSVIGTTVIASGMTLAKSVPLARLDSFHRTGMGAAPAWQVFCIDGGVAFTDAITAVGDTRLRLDLEAVRDLGVGLAWGPVDIFMQTGEPSPTCPRTQLGGVFFVFVTAAEVMGFGTSHADTTAFVNSQSLVGDLGTAYVGSWIGHIITIGAAISAISCAAASTVGSSRLVFALSRDGAGPARLSGLSDAGVPRAAAAVIMVTTAVFFTVGWIISKGNPFNTAVVAGTAGTLVLLVAYAMATLGCMRLLFFSGQRTVSRWEAVIPAAGLVVLGYTLYRNLYPFPVGSAWWGPGLFLAFTLILAAFVLLRPEMARKAGLRLTADEGLTTTIPTVAAAHRPALQPDPEMPRT